MSDCIPCRALANCLQFQDFLPSVTKDKLYLSKAKTIVVTCPSGETAATNLDAGIIGYVLNFELGNPPYPNLTLNCTNGQLSIPVPDTATQAELDALINGMLDSCLTQMATTISCGAGVFYNTLQSYTGCVGDNPCVQVSGALPGGVIFVNQTGETPSMIQIAAGTIQSTVSVADANFKANQVLMEIFTTGNAKCTNCSG